MRNWANWAASGIDITQYRFLFSRRPMSLQVGADALYFFRRRRNRDRRCTAGTPVLRVTQKDTH
jgi:hypothetical protein